VAIDTGSAWRRDRAASFGQAATAVGYKTSMSKDSLARRLIGVPWPPLLAVALMVSLSVAFFVRRSVDQPVSRASSLTILVSGDTQGLLYAADCGPGQHGGLTRRGTLVGALRRAGPLLYAEVGNAPAGNTPYDRLTFETILRGEAAMGVAAHNLGPNELALEIEELRRLASELKIPFVSTNVRDEDGRPLAETLRFVELAGRQVAVAGIVSPRYSRESVQVLDPAVAITDALAEKRSPYDTLLVLAYLPSPELTQLAARLPEKAVLVGPGASDAAAVGGNVAGSVGRFGRSIVRIDLDGQTWTSQEIAIDRSLAEERAQTEIVVAYHQQLEKLDFAADTTGRAIPLPIDAASSTQVAGTNSCRTCHVQECADWDTTRHALAWQSLWNRGVHFDAACQRCHTTGYGWQGGFQSAESFTAWNVGCESCHGPSMAHVLNPAVRTPLVAQQQCVQCHDAERSPAFDYESAWRQVQHGVEPSSKNSGF
jgi:hypothetical protein